VIPFVGNSNAKKGFIDTGTDLSGWDPHVYVSVEAVEEMARMIGWQPAHVQQGTKERAAVVQADLESARAEVEALTEQLAAVRVLKNSGFAQANPPGRPKKVTA
jgi:hypothetical protein